eukprot:Selendium_serpulae@DN5954_c1_g1_i3.p2
MQPDTQTDSETDRHGQTHRQTDRQIGFIRASPVGLFKDQPAYTRQTDRADSRIAFCLYVFCILEIKMRQRQTETHDAQGKSPDCLPACLADAPHSTLNVVE